jgi:CRP/FNR family cyclic AMP-dependent transcriptional regulator
MLDSSPNHSHPDFGPLSALLGQGTVQSYPKKAILITEGDVGNSAYLILTGRLKVYSSDDQGKELTIAFCGPGELVGEMAIDGSRRSASVIAVEPTRCEVIPHQRLRELITADPDLASRLIHLLIGRSRSATQTAKELALENVYCRVARLLNEMAEEADEKGHREVPGRLSQQDIADRVGSSRDMVNRIFKELSQGGYIEANRQRIVLLKSLPARW